MPLEAYSQISTFSNGFLEQKDGIRDKKNESRIRL